MGSGPSKETSVEEFRTSDHVLSKGQHIITALVDDAPTVNILSDVWKFTKGTLQSDILPQELS